MATFGPFFAWGAAGDFRPAIVVAVAFALGVLLVYALRRHLLDFLGRALAGDGSITVNDFAARLCGNDPRVRRLAACLTVFALAGFILCELIGVANVIKPMLSGDSAVTYIWIVGLLVLTAAMTMLSGQSGVMHSAQLQLGILLFGLFTSTVFLIYLQISTLRAMPPRGTFAIAAIVVLCAVLLIYRRNRYIDSTSLRGSDADPNEREPARFRRLRRFQKVLNTTISVVAVLVIVVAGMELYSLGLPTIASDSAAAVQTASRVPAWGFAALVLFPLAYPIVDIVNWQRLAAFEKDRDWSYFGPGQWPAALREFFVTYAVESPLMWLFLCMFGAVATLNLAPDGSDAVQAFVSQMVSDQNFVAEWTLSLLLVAVLAIALSTTTAALSASLAAIRYDLVPMSDAASVRGARAAGGNSRATHHDDRRSALRRHRRGVLRCRCGVRGELHQQHVPRAPLCFRLSATRARPTRHRPAPRQRPEAVLPRMGARRPRDGSRRRDRRRHHLPCHRTRVLALGRRPRLPRLGRRAVHGRSPRRPVTPTFP